MKTIVFDTNYINKIVDNEVDYYNILDSIKADYRFGINIATFVEVLHQSINKEKRYIKIMNLFNKYDLYVGDFIEHRCIENVESFSFELLMNMSKNDRKQYFYKIMEMYYELVCKIITFYMEWVMILIFLGVTNSIDDTDKYIKYLEKKSKKYCEEFQKKFRKDNHNIKIKDFFNDCVYTEMKKIKNMGYKIDNIKLNEYIRYFNDRKSELMKIFEVNSQEDKNTRDSILKNVYDKEIKPFLDSRFNDELFEEYLKSIFFKITVNCGKMNANDISDALIIYGLEDDDILITNDNRIIKFLKEKNKYNDNLYQIFNLTNKIV